MQKIVLDKQYKKIHFIGIGGVSMSGLALLLKNSNFKVQGSDGQNSNNVENLNKNGLKIYIGHSKENMDLEIDLVVYTAAIKDDNEELIFAKNNNIKAIDRATLLGMIMKNYKSPIAIAGTHGKSTTTSIVSKIFLEASLDPTISVGGTLKEINGNLRDGGAEYFIFEACEYYDSFLQFFPKVACILNVELDHVDYFKDFDAVIKSFNRFAKNISKDGYLIINNSIERLEDILENVECNIFTVGDKNSRLYADNIIYDENGYPSFDVIFDGQLIKNLKISQVGEHNIFNTLASIGISICTNVNLESAFSSISGFDGLNRRFQIKGEYKGCKVIDDYAHHPTEIYFALSAQKEATKNKSFVIFQPHTFTRTKQFYKEFAKSLLIADCVILIDIYAAREKNEYNISSKDILEILLDNKKEAYYFESNEEVIKFIKTEVKNGDSLVTMGAGDVYKIGETLLEK